METKHTKICKTCKEVKDISRFTISSKRKNKIYYRNQCLNCYSSLTRERHWKRRGISFSWQEFEDLLRNQDFKCQICEISISSYQENRKRNFSGCLDHNHKTGKVRGILCENCNRALGLFKDSIKNINSALKYLDSK